MEDPKDKKGIDILQIINRRIYPGSEFKAIGIRTRKTPFLKHHTINKSPFLDSKSKFKCTFPIKDLKIDLEALQRLQEANKGQIPQHLTVELWPGVSVEITDIQEYYDSIEPNDIVEEQCNVSLSSVEKPMTNFDFRHESYWSDRNLINYIDTAYFSPVHAAKDLDAAEEELARRGLKQDQNYTFDSEGYVIRPTPKGNNMLLATQSTIDGFIKLMEEAGLEISDWDRETFIQNYLDDDNYSAAMDNAVKLFWADVTRKADTVMTTRDSNGQLQYIIEDHGVTSQNVTAVEALIGWALFSKGSKNNQTNQVKPTLSENEQTVEGVLKKFMDEGRSFTAHDVTLHIRRDVNNGFSTWESNATVNLHGKQVPLIIHDDIRDIVHTIMASEDSYMRSDNGIFQLYAPRF